MSPKTETVDAPSAVLPPEKFISNGFENLPRLVVTSVVSPTMSKPSLNVYTSDAHDPEVQPSITVKRTGESKEVLGGEPIAMGGVKDDRCTDVRGQISGIV